MKKLFAILPIIGLILGAVAIATEIRKPLSFDQMTFITVPKCERLVSTTERAKLQKDPLLCAQ